MQATITYLLTEQAQRAAMAATGQPVARKQTLTIDITTEDLELLPVSEDGTISVDLADTWRRWHTSALIASGGWTDNKAGKPLANVIDPPILADVRKGLEILAAAAAAEAEIIAANDAHNQAVTEAAFQRFLANPNPSALIGGYGADLRTYVGDVRSPAGWYPESHAGFQAEIERRRQLRKAENEAAKAAKEAAKVEAISAWVAAHGTESQRARHAAGLLPRQEATSAMAEAAFAAGADLRQFHAHELEPECSSEQCAAYECEIERTEMDYTDGLDAESFARYESIKALFPAATISLRQYTAFHDCGHNEDCHTGHALTCVVSVKFGPFGFEREYAL